MARAVTRRIRTSTSAITVGTTQSNTALVATSEKETLVGIKGFLYVGKYAATDNQPVALAIQLAPSGDVKWAACGANPTDDGDSFYVLWHCMMHSGPDPASLNHLIPIDIRTMRKLRVGDDIVLSAYSTGSNAALVFYSLSLFFKET